MTQFKEMTLRKLIPILKSKLIILLGLSLFVASCATKYEVYRVSDLDKQTAKNIEGVTYSLPKTTASLVVPVTKKVVTKGRYAAYAKEFLDIEVPQANSIKYSTGKPSISISVAADPEQTFIVKLDGGVLENREVVTTLNERGLITTGSATVESKAVDITLTAIDTVAGLVAANITPMTSSSQLTSAPKKAGGAQHSDYEAVLRRELAFLDKFRRVYLSSELIKYVLNQSELVSELSDFKLSVDSPVWLSFKDFNRLSQLFTLQRFDQEKLKDWDKIKTKQSRIYLTCTDDDSCAFLDHTMSKIAEATDKIRKLNVGFSDKYEALYSLTLLNSDDLITDAAQCSYAGNLEEQLGVCLVTHITTINIYDNANRELARIKSDVVKTLVSQRRNFFTSGRFANMSAEAIDKIVADLDKQIKIASVDFRGSSKEITWLARFDWAPTKDQDSCIATEIMALDKAWGVKGLNGVNGCPQISNKAEGVRVGFLKHYGSDKICLNDKDCEKINVGTEKSSNLIADTVSDNTPEPKGDEANGYYYRIPGMADISLTKNSSTEPYFSSEIAINQLGVVRALPSSTGSWRKSSMNVEFYPNLGSIKKVTASGEALSTDSISQLGESIKTYNTADDARDLAQAQAALPPAATDELADLQRTRDILKVLKEIEDLENPVPSEGVEYEIVIRTVEGG